MSWPPVCGSFDLLKGVWATSIDILLSALSIEKTNYKLFEQKQLLTCAGLSAGSRRSSHSPLFRTLH
jgi:hypothetical protein